MKLIKTVVFMLLVLVLILSFPGCSSKGKVKVDKEGNIIVKEKDSDGNEIVIGDKKWDKSKMFGLEAPKAKFETSLISGDGAMYGFSEMRENDAREYIEALKAAGFTYYSVTIDDYIFNGTNKGGVNVSFTYEKDSATGTVMVSQGEIPTGDDNSAVIGGSDKKWDSAHMGGLPDPGTKVTMYWADENITQYTLEAIPSFADYTKKIETCEFTEDVEKIEMDELYIYAASNSVGDRVIFSASEDMITIALEKSN